MPLNPLLEGQGIRKSYSGVQALKSASFELLSGEVHALVGENGAGKSTLIKIVTGAVERDDGTLNVCGNSVARLTPAVARSLGIAAVYQQPSLWPDLSVCENIALSDEAGSSWKTIDWKARRKKAAILLERAGSRIDPDRIVNTLSMPEQQILEIARAIGAEAKILILDEPTASLTVHEVESLFQAIRSLRAQGVGIIYISHRLEEIAEIADRVTVMRDGSTVGTFPMREIDRPALIEMMVGRPLESVYPKRAVNHGQVAVELRSITSIEAGIHDVSLSLRCGEILGLSGLVGAGRTELAETIFGLRLGNSGEIRVADIPVRIDSPRIAIEHGIAYVPEDRRRHGIVLDMPIVSNTSLASLDRVSRAGWIVHRRECELADEYIGRLRIKASSRYSNASELSGGNQQKVALARWLAIGPKILILDEPTQGVDIGSKFEIHNLIAELAQQGVAIILISSELPEILGMSDRIAVMRAGGIAGILSSEQATPQKLLALALGDSFPDENGDNSIVPHSFK
jgi:rhamnose transport system ATP-binding protein